MLKNGHRHASRSRLPALRLAVGPGARTRGRPTKETHRPVSEALSKRGGGQPNEGSALRVVDAFGLSYAAGMLAKGYKILPREFKCLEAAKACYVLYRAESGALLQLRERLTDISQRAPIDLDNCLAKMSDAELVRVSAFVRTTRSGRREILFTQAARDRHFPDWGDIKRDHNARGLFKADSKRDTVRRKIRAGNKSEHVYRFFLPMDA